MVRQNVWPPSSGQNDRFEARKVYFLIRQSLLRKGPSSPVGGMSRQGLPAQQVPTPCLPSSFPPVMD